MTAHDAETIAEANNLGPIAIGLLSRALAGDAVDGVSVSGDFIAVQNKTILKAAWGPRRVSSRTRGMKLDAYPDQVVAIASLWRDWITQEKGHVSVVIAKKKAQARIDAALGHSHADPEMSQAEPDGQISQDEIDELMAERARLRASRMFTDADKVRDYLTACGVTVADHRIGTN